MVDDPADLVARFREVAERDPDHPALIWRDQRVSYGELDRRSAAVAGGLQHLGVRPGDRVALLLGTTPRFVEAYLATLRAGAIAVPMNPEAPAPELARILVDCEPLVLVVADVPDGSLVDELRSAAPSLAHVVVAGSAPGAGTGVDWEQLVGAGHEPEPVDREPDDVALLVYTSGTTGRPKGAMLSRRNLAANQDQALATRLAIEPDDVVLTVLPLFHIYALNVGLGCSLRVGATLALVERFDPVASLEMVAAHDVSVILGAPPMYLAWLHVDDAERYDLRGVRVAVSGAAPLPAHVLDAARRRLGLTIWEGYGLTEAAPAVTSCAMLDEPVPGSVGRELPDLEVRLVGEDGGEVEPGDPGEIWVRGPNVFRGYWKDRAATAEALTDDGWLRTGDIAVRGPDGALRIVDRATDLIVVSGFNVYPREVEEVLEDHPRVLAAAVVGVPHPYSGESVRAVIVPDPDATLSEDEVVAWTRDRLARYKVPTAVRFVDRLPHTPTGKVRRRDVRGTGAPA